MALELGFRPFHQELSILFKSVFQICIVTGWPPESRQGREQKRIAQDKDTVWFKISKKQFFLIEMMSANIFFSLISLKHFLKFKFHHKICKVIL